MPHRGAVGDSWRGGHYQARALARCRPVAARMGRLAIRAARRGVPALRRRSPRRRRPWWSPPIPPCRCRGRCGSSVLTTWMRSRYGTAGGISTMNCRFVFGSGCCEKAGVSLRSVAVTRTPNTSRSVRRRRSCMRVNSRYLRSSTGCAAAAHTSPDHGLSQWNSPRPPRAGTPLKWPGLGRHCGCRPRRQSPSLPWSPELLAQTPP